MNQRAQTTNQPEKQKEEKKQQVTWFALNCVKTTNLNCFILDSGTTEHLVRANLENFMTNVTELEEEVIIHTADNGRMTAKKRGDLLSRCQGINIKIDALIVSGM